MLLGITILFFNILMRYIGVSGLPVNWLSSPSTFKTYFQICKVQSLYLELGNIKFPSTCIWVKLKSFSLGRAFSVIYNQLSQTLTILNYFQSSFVLWYYYKIIVDNFCYKLIYDDFPVFIPTYKFTQQGNESLPVLSQGSERGTGFTHGTKARPVFYSKVGQVRGVARYMFTAHIEIVLNITSIWKYMYLRVQLNGPVNAETTKTTESIGTKKTVCNIQY